MKRYVLACHEGAPNGPAPKLLSEQGIDRILHRTILGWSPNIGLYGAGGPGFWGFKLAETDQYPEEWLILTVWNAGDCLLFDGEKGEVVAAEFIAMHPDAGVEAFYRALCRPDQRDHGKSGRIEDHRSLHHAELFRNFISRQADRTHRLEIPKGAQVPLSVDPGNRKKISATHGSSPNKTSYGLRVILIE
ncbi:MAG: hypothetical protein MPW15_01945 [Candidatus Manganitrophus sp.]|nr:hypothetical protein [Candidatus Manganitrophus sp.]